MREILILSFVLSGPLLAADAPYFVTYGHHMEEPGSLEIAIMNVTGKPGDDARFVNSLLELEYGVNGWWTSELYLLGQSTRHEGALYTGWRSENRFRLLPREHWINPVLYVEYASGNGADKSLKEVVGFDGKENLLEPNASTRLETKREIETKLILSSNFRGWNVSGNMIAEKNLGGGAWEFGYAAGISRPLALEASPEPCQVCRENFRAGVELYGGLGDRWQFGFRDTSQYLGPTLAWQSPNGTRLQISPTFGLTSTSAKFLLRFGISYEIPAFGRIARGLFR